MFQRGVDSNVVLDYIMLAGLSNKLVTYCISKYLVVLISSCCLITYLESSFLFLLRAIFFSRTFLSLRASLALGCSCPVESPLFCFL